MATDEQFDIVNQKEETFRDEPTAAILDEKEWSYLKRFYDMSPRELQIAQLVCCGYTNGDIAGKLNIRSGTVKTHLRSIFGKTRTRNRVSMLVKYIEKVQHIRENNGSTYTVKAVNSHKSGDSEQIQLFE